MESINSENPGGWSARNTLHIANMMSEKLQKPYNTTAKKAALHNLEDLSN